MPYTLNLTFTHYDLADVVSRSASMPSEQALMAFKKAFHVLESLPKTADAKAAANALKGVIKDRDARWILLDVLGVCGVLASKEFPGFWPTFQEFQFYADFEVHTFQYPVLFWKRSDGIDLDALSFFGLRDYIG